MAEDVRAIERWEWDEIEYGEDEVEPDAEVENHGDGDGGAGRAQAGTGDVSGEHADHFRAGGVEPCEQNEQDGGGYSAEQIAHRAGDGGEDVIAAQVFEIERSYRSGLGPADEISVGEKKEHGQRNEDGSEGIDVLDGIQSETAQHPRGWIAEAGGHPCMRGLVQAQAKNEDGKLEEFENSSLLAHEL